MEFLRKQEDPYFLPLKWSAREHECPVQQPRDLVRGMVILLKLLLFMAPSTIMHHCLEAHTFECVFADH